MPGISVFKIEDALPKRPHQPQRLGVVGQPAIVFTGDQDAGDIIAGGKGLQVAEKSKRTPPAMLIPASSSAEEPVLTSSINSKSPSLQALPSGGGAGWYMSSVIRSGVSR